MTSDLDLMYCKGQQFTRRDDRHTHCVVLELLPDTLSYLVCFTATGNLLAMPEKILRRHYVASTALDQQDALALLGTARPPAAADSSGSVQLPARPRSALRK